MVESSSPGLGTPPLPLSSVIALSEIPDVFEGFCDNLEPLFLFKPDVKADDLLVACGGDRDGWKAELVVGDLRWADCCLRWPLPRSS